MKKELMVALILIAAFLALKISSFTYSISDENTYYLMGKSVSEGQAIYRDFFFSHPPLQVVMFALLIKIFGFNFVILKATSTIAIAVAAFFTYLIIEGKIGGKEAILGTGLFLFSYDTLRFSTYPTGVEITVMLAVISFYFLLNRRLIIAGIFSGLAAITGLYALIAVLAFLTFLMLKHREGALKFTIAFLAVFGGTNAIMLLIAGPGYIEQAYFYHLMKPDEAGNKAEMIQRLVMANIVLWASALLFAASRKRLKNEIFISLGILLGYWTFFIISKKVFAYYMLLAFPFAAVIGAYSIMNIDFRMSKRAVFLAASLIIAASAAISAFSFTSYDYQDFGEAEEIAAYIRQNSEEGDKIYGDESITPLLSILSGRSIALNHIDSNALRFKSGITGINETIAGLEAKFFIEYRLNVSEGTIRYGVASLPEFENFIRECRLSKAFRSGWREYMKEYYVYDCEH